MKPGDLVTVWLGEKTEYGRTVRGWICGPGTYGNEDGKTFQDHMDERVKNGLSRLYEWESPAGAIRLIDEKDLGVVWLPGHSDEIERAILAARALM